MRATVRCSTSAATSRSVTASSPTLLIDVAGAGRVEYVDWPAEKKAIDIGSFYTDSTKFKSATGWSPTVALRDGLTRTIAFYREHWPRYVEAAATEARP